jgi:glycine cleavage system regulatory protein
VVNNAVWPGGRILTRSLVLTLIGPDRPGLVEALARSIAAHDANWLESRMSRLAGKFAGILLVDVPDDQAEALTRSLRELQSEGLTVVIEHSTEEEAPRDWVGLQLSLVGQDRPGIIRDISRALAGRGVNVEELSTGCTSAPMSGEALFHATARLQVPKGAPLEELREALEALANDLMVDLTLRTPGSPTQE